MQGGICDELVFDDFGANELRDFKEVIVGTGNAEEECYWVAYVSEDEFEGQRWVVDVDVSVIKSSISGPTCIGGRVSKDKVVCRN